MNLPRVFEEEPKADIAALTATMEGCNPKLKQCATLTLKGYGNDEIASEVGIALTTVKQRMKVLYIHFGLHEAGRMKRVLLVAKLIALRPEEPGAEMCHLFTRKQVHVIDLVTLGHTNESVAAELGTTDHVIKNYLRSIYDTAGVWTRLELAIWWRSHRGRGEGREGRPSRSGSARSYAY